MIPTMTAQDKIKQVKQEKIDDQIRDELAKADKAKKTKADMFWEDVRWEIEYRWDHWFYYPYRNMMQGFGNLRKYRKLIWNDRWYDYSFLLELMLFKLKDTEEHWGVDTHYVNDLDDKEILKKLVEDLEWMINTDEFNEGYTEEYKKRSRSFFGRLDRQHRKLWD